VQPPQPIASTRRPAINATTSIWRARRARADADLDYDGMGDYTRGLIASRGAS
jgi:hypothetical protein